PRSRGTGDEHQTLLAKREILEDLGHSHFVQSSNLCGYDPEDCPGAVLLEQDVGTEPRYSGDLEGEIDVTTLLEHLFLDIAEDVVDSGVGFLAGERWHLEGHHLTADSDQRRHIG